MKKMRKVVIEIEESTEKIEVLEAKGSEEKFVPRENKFMSPKDVFKKLTELAEKYHCKFDVIDQTFFINDKLSDVDKLSVIEEFEHWEKILRLHLYTTFKLSRFMPNKKKSIKKIKLKNWSDLTIFINTEPDDKGRSTNWLGAYYDHSGKHKIGFTPGELRYLQCYYDGVIITSKQKQRVNDRIKEYFEVDKDVNPLGDSSRNKRGDVNFNIDFIHLFEQHRERITKNCDGIDYHSDNVTDSDKIF